MILRDGFRLCVDDEFVGIAAARFAKKGGAPLAKDSLELFLGNGGELLDGFDGECAQGALRDFADAGNFSHGKRREEASFLAGRDPEEPARLGLVGGDFRDQARRGEAAGARKARRPRDGAQEFIGGGEGRAMQALRAGEVEIGFVDGNHLYYGRKFRQDRCDAIAPFGVFRVITVEKNGVRA